MKVSREEKSLMIELKKMRNYVIQTRLLTQKCHHRQHTIIVFSCMAVSFEINHEADAVNYTQVVFDVFWDHILTL